jgi:hypothetical protein
MKRIGLLGMLALAAGPASAPTIFAAFSNGDFEGATIGSWHAIGTDDAAGLTLDAKAHGGKQAAHFDGTAAAPNGFGGLGQTIDATPYRGKLVRFSAWIRADEPSGGNAALWLRVDLPSGMGFFDNMNDRPIPTGDWKRFEIVGDVAADAKDIALGVMQEGKGELWIDDAVVEIAGNVPVAAPDPPRALAGRGLVNLVAFARLLGYVRHFHPSDEAAAADWDELAIAGVNEVEAAKDPADLAHRLQALFAPVAPTVVVSSGKPVAPAILAKKGTQLTVWRHEGFGQAPIMKGNVYASERIHADASAPMAAPFSDPAQPPVYDLGGGVSALVPIVLYADAQGTLPHGKPAAAPPPHAPRHTDSRATRLAGVILAWNVFEHFYPYFDVEKVDWPHELEVALGHAATDDAKTYVETLERLVAALHDGHGNVYDQQHVANAVLPLTWGIVEGELTVLTTDPASGLHPGDVVTKIDGAAALDQLAAHEELEPSATPQWAEFRALRTLAMGEPGSSVALDLDDGRSITLARAPLTQLDWPTETRPAQIAQVEPGIWYVDLGRVDDDSFEKAVPDLASARGVIFDMRGYPKMDPEKLFEHLADQPLQSAHWVIPVVTKPDGKDWTWHEDGRWNIVPAAPRFKGKLAFLTDGRAISFAESVMGIVEAYKLGDIVGATTAGTNGNINPFHIVGDLTIVYTGMRVLKNDGSRHHGVGIAPTVPVARTRAGVRAGKDEVLIKACELVKR